MDTNNIRWKQRLINFTKATNQLAVFVHQKELNLLEAQGLIKAFEYTYELGWKTLQDFYKHKGLEHIIGPKPVIEQSFKDGIIKDGKGWVDMHKSRNLTSHTYNEETATDIVNAIHTSYFNLLKELEETLQDMASSERHELFEGE